MTCVGNGFWDTLIVCQPVHQKLGVFDFGVAHVIRAKCNGAHGYHHEAIARRQ